MLKKRVAAAALAFAMAFTAAPAGVYAQEPGQSGIVRVADGDSRYVFQDEKVLAEYPQYEVVCQALESGVYRPVISQWTEFYTTLGSEMDNIINGAKTVEEGLNDAQEALEELMAE